MLQLKLDFEINHVQTVHQIIVLLKVILFQDIEDKIYILQINFLFHFEKLPERQKRNFYSINKYLFFTFSRGIIESLHFAIISRNSSTDIDGGFGPFEYKRLK
jgi:hypothetical protein